MSKHVRPWRCFSNDTSGGNRKLVLLFILEGQSKDHKLCAAATVEQPRKKNLLDSITYRSQSRWICRRRKPETLLLPYPADQMRMWEISPRVNSPKNDDHRFGNPFMRSQHRRQPLRLNSCASRQTRLRDFHGPKRDSHQLSTRFPANSVWSDPDNLSKRLFGTIWL
jgi:hypothetical protein